MKKFLSILLIFVSLTLSASEPRDTTIVNLLRFQLNKSEFVKGDPGYWTFMNKTLPYYYGNMDKVEYIGVHISSSPEGPLSRNKVLTEERARRILDYFPDDANIELGLIEENYDGVLEQVDSTNRETVESIISSGVDVKRRLMKLPYINAALFNLRYARIEIRFRADVPVEPIHDTVIVNQIDTIYIVQHDTIYLEKSPRTIPILGVKTNLVADAALAPNVHAELYTHLAGLSLEFEYTFPWWKTDVVHRYYQILNGTAGIRKYFRNSYTGHYVGAYVNTAIYDLQAKTDQGFQGELNGIGLSYGYVFASKKDPRLKFEPYIRIGCFNTRFDEYHTSEPFDGRYYYTYTGKSSDFVPRRFKMTYFGPTMIGFNLTYDLICLRRY